ncbi:unnamed protein product [Pelagomonas calceolata]|uniref:Uncharacterized protein n=3 Tax=Pelagomonas calceolata TaxID=35677 RepID=A0A8J2WXK1_9STRA|nr:unnamed protein product [Pelagomonas calceolata]
MKPRIAPSGLRSRYCRGAYDDPAATGAGLLDAPFAPALRLPEPSETPPARPEKVRPGARPDKPAVPCPKGKLTGWSRAASARCRYGPSLEARLANDGAWYPGVSEEERRGKTRWLVRGSGARYGFLSLRLGRRAAERAIGAAATGVAPADCGGDADVLAPPPARGRRRERGWAARAADPAQRAAAAKALARRLGDAWVLCFAVLESSRLELRLVVGRPRDDLCANQPVSDDRKWAYAVGDAVALVFDLRDERVPATLAFAPRRAFGADGVLRLDASGGPLAPGVAGAPGGPESAAPPKDSRAAAGRVWAAAPGGDAKAALQLRYWIRALQHANHSVTVAPFASRGDRHKTECLFCRCGVAPWHPRPANFGIPAHGLCHSEVACDKCVVKNEEALQDERRPKNLRKPLFWFRPDPHPVIVPVDRPLAPAVEPPAPPRNGRAAAALARINEGAANRAPDGPLRVSLLACAAALRAAARAEGAGRAAEAAEAAERVVKKHPAPPHPLIRDAYALGVDYVCRCVASGLGPAHAGNVERWRSFWTSRVMDEEERLFEDRVEACWRIVLDEVAPGVARDAATKAHAAALRAGRKRLAALARKFRRACERAADGAVAVARAAAQRAARGGRDARDAAARARGAVKRNALAAPVRQVTPPTEGPGQKEVEVESGSGASSESDSDESDDENASGSASSTGEDDDDDSDSADENDDDESASAGDDDDESASSEDESAQDDESASARDDDDESASAGDESARDDDDESASESSSAEEEEDASDSDDDTDASS